jgi:hypothetical protein
MGAWGYGILQNDDSQDGLAALIHVIEDEIVRLAAWRRDERSTARLGAMIGLLLQMASWYSFDPEKEVSRTIHSALERHEPLFGVLPRRARTLLLAVLEGKGKELTARPGKLNRSVRRALFATDSDGFPMERVFAKREPSLFEHREAARYVQEFADHCVSVIDEDFADESIVDDLSRESTGMGAFGTLLVLEPCHVKPSKFVAWRKRWHTVLAAHDEEFEPDDFEREYNKNVELAFRLALKKFATK